MRAWGVLGAKKLRARCVLGGTEKARAGRSRGNKKCAHEAFSGEQKMRPGEKTITPQAEQKHQGEQQRNNTQHGEKKRKLARKAVTADADSRRFYKYRESRGIWVVAKDHCKQQSQEI